MRGHMSAHLARGVPLPCSAASAHALHDPLAHRSVAAAPSAALVESMKVLLVSCAELPENHASDSRELCNGPQRNIDWARHLHSVLLRSAEMCNCSASAPGAPQRALSVLARGTCMQEGRGACRWQWGGAASLGHAQRARNGSYVVVSPAAAASVALRVA